MCFGHSPPPPPPPDPKHRNSYWLRVRSACFDIICPVALLFIHPCLGFLRDLNSTDKTSTSAKGSKTHIHALMTTVVASASACYKHRHRTANASHASFIVGGSDATREIYGYAILGLSFLLASLLYLGHGALSYDYSDPSTTGTSNIVSTTANMSSSDGGFRYRRVDSGQANAEVLRYVMERKGPTEVHVESTSPSPNNNHGNNNGIPVSMEEGMTILSQGTSESIQMAKGISTLISNSSFDGVFFEMPGVDSSTVSTTPLEFVLVDAPSLARFAESDPDRYAFEEHLGQCAEEQTCCAFDNLGGDARLIAPRMMRDDRRRQPETYSHLAAFVRGADEGQIIDMWRLSASEYLRTVQGRRTTGARTWFSTSGLGVAWLHVRLDSYPKYYQYGPFKT